MRMLLVLLLVLAAAACGGDADDPAADADRTSPDTAFVDALPGDTADQNREGAGAGRETDGQDGPVERTTSPGGAAEDTRNEGNDGDASSPPTEAGPPQLPARYRLAYVDGEALPVTIDENPDCRVELVRGDVWIRNDLSFELQAESRTICGGETIGDDLQTAGGTVVRNGNRLRFEAAGDQFFATAVGSYTSAGHIDVDSLLFDAEARPVDWRFLR